MTKGTALVAGGGGFIGGHMTRRLLDEGWRVRAVDFRPIPEWHHSTPGIDNRVLDLRIRESCRAAVEGVDAVYNLACDMGGMGFISAHRVDCMISVLINTHLLMEANAAGVKQYFFSSSACVYNTDKQENPDSPALREEDAYPALCEDGYGWEKLFGERMCRNFSEEHPIRTRIARFHNVYGPNGTWEGGREKAPAAICRKVAEAKLSDCHDIDIWGDGEQTRSFMYIDDCLQGARMLMESDHGEPLNLGSDRLVTINQMVDIVEGIAGIRLKRRYQLDKPQGVRGRNSDNTRLRRVLGWEPGITLEDGLERTYRWIHDQVAARDGR